MASMASVTLAATPSPTRRQPAAGNTAFFSPLKASTNAATPRPAKPGRSLQVRASSSSGKEQVATGLAAAAMAAAFIVPEVAEAAQPGISPSLKNFLLSIVSGGVVLTAILGAVIGVSNFDPVKRT
ncbi:uncharacterized protein M6B38_376720 [Iris pallida]|uniref:Ultraviolet-B-repressible protein n=1 Tax=Iris pallida TaxID=29817 RepID=A0AAX6GAQ2_IRIPA|nr:uncharacterized protein M6B38_196985 [Iris pallida]KAJ6825553.1 uncharacterized protein M6B38_376720 [Iris pallida]